MKKKKIILAVIIFILLLFFIFLKIAMGLIITEDKLFVKYGYKQDLPFLERKIEKDNTVYSLGTLTIDSIGLYDAPIKEGTENYIIDNYIGHFYGTSFYDGNICLLAHNRGYKKNYFENLKSIKMGDEIIYNTNIETKKFKVSEIKTIKDTDFFVLNGTNDTRLTLITCVENKKNLRLCVIGLLIEDKVI